MLSILLTFDIMSYLNFGLLNVQKKSCNLTPICHPSLSPIAKEKETPTMLTHSFHRGASSLTPLAAVEYASRRARTGSVRKATEKDITCEILNLIELVFCLINRSSNRWDRDIRAVTSYNWQIIAQDIIINWRQLLQENCILRIKMTDLLSLSICKIIWWKVKEVARGEDYCFPLDMT